ncbi:Uncharacterised protein [Streptococcus pyogenes]|nr:Uncharacterised protein [Streptococcus pyogenes]VGU11453.1 Uncharacterised protein [Streptococcus pyogenes]VGV83645.1 Uncharacterised protein [Streptococcus pyogenes]VHA03137.1 Uncharacterised protein [Streptococcus pyogenes]VHA18855.1 Uncharacterised protein [Streptococcus pyogenes]
MTDEEFADLVEQKMKSTKFLIKYIGLVLM